MTSEGLQMWPHLWVVFVIFLNNYREVLNQGVHFISPVYITGDQSILKFQLSKNIFFLLKNTTQVKAAGYNRGFSSGKSKKYSRIKLNKKERSFFFKQLCTVFT